MDPEQPERFCRNIAIVSHGELKAIGTAEELKAKACEKFGGEQFLPPEVKSALLEIWNGQKRAEGGENA